MSPSDDLDDTAPTAVRADVAVALTALDTSVDRVIPEHHFDESRRLTGHGKHSRNHIKELARAARKQRLAPEKGTSLDVLLDNMRVFWNAAKDLEARTLSESGASARWIDMPKEDREDAMALRLAAGDQALKAAPFLHAKLAPHVPKGSGQVVALIIEDA